MYNVDNLLANVLEWDKLATLIDGQSVHGFDKRVAAGLLKVLLKTKTNYSYQVASRKTQEFNCQVKTEVRLLLANSIEDVFASADIATWVAFNYEHIDEQVLATIRVLDIHCKPQDNIGFYLHASKLFFAANDEERVGGI